MKIYILFLLIFFSLLLANCAKDKPNNNSDHVPGLPPATQIGANTFGCLVNGVPWVPQGSNGTNNLSIDYDPDFDNGIFNIAARNFLSANGERIVIGIRDSLNFINPPHNYKLSNASLFRAIFMNNCIIESWKTDVQVFNGSLTINTLNKQLKIIAGTFEFHMTKDLCDTIKITKGRFDFKF
jgi:hypothetical protein